MNKHKHRKEHTKLERIYTSPFVKEGLSDTEVIQEAVFEAKRNKTCVIVIPPKDNGENWVVKSPIKLPTTSPS